MAPSVQMKEIMTTMGLEDLVTLYQEFGSSLFQCRSLIMTMRTAVLVLETLEDF